MPQLDKIEIDDNMECDGLRKISENYRQEVDQLREFAKIEGLEVLQLKHEKEV